MARRESTLSLRAAPLDAYRLVLQAGSELAGFRLESQDQNAGRFHFRRGWGLTNPVEVKIALVAQPDGTTLAHIEASILALADPFGFLTETLERFESHIQAHVAAFATGHPVQPPPPARRGLYVTLGTLGCFFVLCVAAGAVMFFTH